MSRREGPYTLVSFHAHPDDEALLTAGSLAKAAADGHRVVLVVATGGGAGLAATSMLESMSLLDRRVAELRRSASALGCARVELLGYGDSGMDGRADCAGEAFARADIETAARRLAALLTEEAADVLTVYDRAGGYGHPDHVQVHRVGVRAAALAGTPVVLEATIDRGALVRATRLLRWCRPFVPGLDLAGLDATSMAAAYTAREDLTHRVDVRRFLPQKRAAMAAHASQATADSGDRMLALLLRLPGPVFRLAMGREWFVESGRTPGRRPVGDLFATLADAAR